jgi:hypothetical protein
MCQVCVALIGVVDGFSMTWETLRSPDWRPVSSVGGGATEFILRSRGQQPIPAVMNPPQRKKLRYRTLSRPER